MTIIALYDSAVAGVASRRAQFLDVRRSGRAVNQSHSVKQKARQRTEDKILHRTDSFERKSVRRKPAFTVVPMESVFTENITTRSLPKTQHHSTVANKPASNDTRRRARFLLDPTGRNQNGQCE
jgi:hypothetical protein